MTRQYSSPTPPARTWPRAASAARAASFKSGCGKWDHPFEASRFRRTRVDGTTPKALCPKLAPVGLNLCFHAVRGNARCVTAAAVVRDWQFVGLRLRRRAVPPRFAVQAERLPVARLLVADPREQGERH